MAIKNMNICTVCKKEIPKKCDGKEYHSEEVKGLYGTIIKSIKLCTYLMKKYKFKLGESYVHVEGHGCYTEARIKKGKNKAKPTKD